MALGLRVLFSCWQEARSPCRSKAALLSSEPPVHLWSWSCCFLNIAACFFKASRRCGHIVLSPGTYCGQRKVPSSAYTQEKGSAQGHEYQECGDSTMGILFIVCAPPLVFAFHTDLDFCACEFSDLLKTVVET